MISISCVGSLIVVIAAGPPVAEVDRCLQAFEEAQLRRAEGALLEARETLAICAEEGCPEVVRRKCDQWASEVDAEIPRLTIEARDEERAVVDASLFIDDQRVADRLDGGPIAVAPGSHRLRVEHPDGRIAEQEVVLDRFARRRVTLSLPKPVPKPVPEKVPSVPAPPPPDSVEAPTGDLWPLVGAGYGLSAAAVVVGAVTGALALGRGDDLARRCAAPGPEACTQNEIDAAVTLAHVSTASFAVAGAALVAGTVALGFQLAPGKAVALTPAPGALYGLGVVLSY